MHILIVEDRPEDRLLLETMLRGTGFKVFSAADGLEALQEMEKERVDLIISDILMPRMDGFRLCRTVKSNENYKDIPFVFYTATYVESEDEQFALSLGAERFIVKPKEPEEFLAILREIIKNHGAKKMPTLPALALLEEERYLKYYNERLIKKLEDKLDQLEATNLGLVIKGEELHRERKLLAATLASKERLDFTLRSLGDAVVTLNTHGKIHLLNHTCEEITGFGNAEAEGKAWSEIFRLKDEISGQVVDLPFDQTVVTGLVFDLPSHIRLKTRDGKEKDIAGNMVAIQDEQGKSIGLVVVFRDITEKKRIEEERQKAQKLESIGVLAGGIAHDFNNILTIVMGNISLAKVMLGLEGLEEKIGPYLMEVEKASHQARSLTRQLLTFARGGAPIRKKVRIEGLMQEWVDFALKGSRLKGQFLLQEGLWPVEVDEGQISQAINNLIRNAGEAMPHGGRIWVSVENVDQSKGGLPNGVILPKGDYIRVAIKDEGIGIPKDILPNIFDPYFTTKREGSGLGLAVAYSIIKNHGGIIWAESEPGRGSVFSFYLPALVGEKLSEEKEPVEMVIKPVAGYQGKILLMDDQKMLRDVLAQMLNLLGYEAVQAKDGQEAIDLYQRAMVEGRPFGVVIMDLIIPGGMGGEEAIKKLRKIDPKVKAIVSSGYSTDPIMADFSKYGFSGCIAKPYEPKDLVQVLHKVIKRKNSPP